MNTPEYELALITVVETAYDQPFTTKSDFARLMADFVAIAASIGLITVARGVFNFSREWRVTDKGITYLKNQGVL